MLTCDVSHMKISVVQLRCHACLLCPGAVVGEGCAGSLSVRVERSRCRGSAAAEAVAAPASAGATRSLYPALVFQPLQGEEEPVPGDGGITSTASVYLCEQNSLSEPCRASPEECCKRWCSTQLQNKEQGTSMMVPPFLFPSLLNVR